MSDTTPSPGWGLEAWGQTPWGGHQIQNPHPNFFYQVVPKLFSGPQKPLGLGPDPEMTGY